jgi:hypothetical protein
MGSRKFLFKTPGISLDGAAFSLRMFLWLDCSQVENCCLPIGSISNGIDYGISLNITPDVISDHQYFFGLTCQTVYGCFG